MKDAMTSFRLLGSAAVVALFALVGCKEKTPVGVLAEYETPAWAGKEGAFIVKTETPDSKIVLMRRRNPEFAWSELTGHTAIEHDFAAGEVIYRYNPDVYSDELEEVDLRAWVDATGPEWWEGQQSARVPKRVRINYTTGEVSYGPNEVPTKGDACLNIARAMYGSQPLAILSATQKPPTYKEIKVGMGMGMGTYKKFYHQAFDTRTLKPVGVPIPLSSESAPSKCIWTGRNNHVVYTDSLHTKVHIVLMYRMPSDEE